MDAFQVVVLSLLQGITEFLPISSSAHLILPAQLFGWVDQGLEFDIAVHLGTLGAVLLYFRKDLLVMANAWVGSVAARRITNESRMAWLLLLATAPVGLFGLVFNDYIEANSRSILVIAIATLVFGLGLYLVEYYGSKNKDISSLSWRGALLIGCLQVFALIPGASRSGVTMTAGLMLGLTHTASARFSFLLSIPVIFGAGLLKILELLHLDHVNWPQLIAGAIIAFISAYCSIGWFLRLIDRVGLMPFVVYRLILGVLLLLFLI